MSGWAATPGARNPLTCVYQLWLANRPGSHQGPGNALVSSSTLPRPRIESVRASAGATGGAGFGVRRPLDQHSRGLMVPGVPGDSFGAAADDYVRYRKGFPPETLDRLAEHEIGTPGQRILDLGCGTGTIARQLAARGCTAVGLDVDHRMLQAAQGMAEADGVGVDWVEAPAESTGLEAGTFDAVVAGQSWHWFDQEDAMAEVGRLLVAGGRLAVCGFDWLPLPDTVPGATEALIEVHNPAWDLGGIRNYEPTLRPLLDRTGFTVQVTFRFDMDVVYDQLAWRRRIAASAGIVNLSPDEAAAFDRDLVQMLDERFPGDEVHTPHRVWGIVATSPGS